MRLGLSALQNMITEAVETQMRSNNGDLTLSSLRASIAKIGMAVESIRTSKNDPNSNKVFCEGKLTLSLPSDLIEDAQASLKASGKMIIWNNFYQGLITKNLLRQRTNTKSTLFITCSPQMMANRFMPSWKTVQMQFPASVNCWTMHYLKNTIINQKLEEKRIEEEEARQAEQLLRQEEKGAAS